MNASLLPRVRRHVLGTASIIPFLALSLTHAQAQPVGASVVAGQAQVSASGATTIINQSTSKAIINWQDFSVGAGAAVQFNQPNSSAITLNRVTGSGLSTIEGAIRANGQVWLLNPNGVLFGNGARVNVGGLLATTSDIANQDFLEGRYNFSSGRNGEIVNNGQIRAHGGGSVILSAPRVTNNGLISANAGRVVLGGANTFTVDFNGDHLLSYAIGASAQTGSVTNSGKITAQGGQILMTARAASGVQDAVINNTGMAEATSAREVNGEIILDAGEGTATNAGMLDASGKAAGQTGGTAKVLGRVAEVADNAVIDVSGDAGGGTALIGGNYQGGGSEMHAQATRIGKATINADAITSGNGGKVVAWSDGRTDFAGSITARGGASGGDGGQVETSGHDLNIPAGAFVSTLAANGKTGNWLLDPHNINIVTGGYDSTTFAGSFNIAPQVDANVDPANIDNAMRSSNLTLQAATDIIFQNNLTINGAGTAGRTLTLQAGRSILLGANSLSYALGNVIIIANDPGGAATGFRDTGLATISSTGGTITAAQLDLVLLSNGADGSSIGTSAAPLLVAGGTQTYIKTQNASAWLTTGAGGTSNFVFGNKNNTLGADLGTGSLTLVSNGAQQQAPISVNNLTVNLPTGLSSGNPVTLTNTGNAITGFVNITAMGRDSQGAPYVQLTNSGVLTLAAINTIPNTSGDTGPAGAAKFITTSGDINLTGVISVTGLTLNAAGKITEIGTPSRITSAAVQNGSQAGSAGVTLIAGSDILLPNSNTIAQNTAATGNGSETKVVTPGRLSVNISGTGNATLNFGSNLQLLQSSLANGALSLTTSGSYTLLNASGGTVTSANGIQIYAPLSATGLLTLSAAGDITQNTSAALDVHITSATGLSATSSGGNIVLDDFGHTGPPVDVGNMVSGFATFSTPGSFTFYNTVKTIVGAPPGPTGAGITSVTGGTIQVFDTVGFTAHNDLVLNSPITTSNTLSLGATGNIINYQGHAPLSAPNISLFTSFGTIGASDGASASPFAMALAPRVTGNTLGFMAQAPNGDVSLNILGSAQIGFGSGINPGLRGNNVLVNLNGNGATVTSLTQTTGTIGQIQANNVNFGIANSITGNIQLSNAVNAIGAVTLAAGSGASLYNTGDLTINAVRGSTGSTSAVNGLVNIQTTGILTLANAATGAIVSTTTSTSSGVVLHAGGAILQGSGVPISASFVTLVSDSGTLGTSLAPLSASTINLSGRTTNKDIYLSAVSFNGSAALGLASTTTTGFGLIANITQQGINAGTGNAIVSAGALAVSATNTLFPIIANNLRVTAASINITNATVSAFSAGSSGNIIFSSSTGFQLSNIFSTNVGSLSTTGAVTLSAQGTISQATGQAGQIGVGGAFTATASGTPGILLTNGLNAIAGTVTLTAPGTIAFVNAVNTVIGRASGGSQGGLSAQMVDIEVLGAGNTLTIGGSGTVINGNTITLHSTGSILEASGGGVITGLNLGLISDTGSIGAFSSTGGHIALRAVGNLAARAPGDIYLISSATFVNSVFVATPITIGSVANLGPGGGTITGITAGGTIGLAFGSFDVFGHDTIKANTLFVSGNSIGLDNVIVNVLSAFSQSGNIDISSTDSFQINNVVSIANNPGITTAGEVSLTSSGTITQASGARAAISAGKLSAFGASGLTLDNSANAISGIIQFGSLGDALLVNSLASHINAGVAGGTLTLVSGGDLELVAGPSLATLSNGKGIIVNSVPLVSASIFANVNGDILSLRTGGDGIVLSTPGKFINNFGATALLAPASRFLVYSADPANDVFGGLKTTDGGVFNTSYPATIAVTGSRYAFSVASSTNTDFMIPVTVVTPTTPATDTNTNTGTAGLTVNSNTAAAPALVGFVSAGQPPPRQPPPPTTRADALQISGALPPPPPPPPPRPNSPLADLFGPDSANSEPPSSSDQATSYVVGSLDGGSPPVVGGSGGGTVIPRYLTTRPNPPTGTLADATLLPAFGNTSLWQ